MVIYIEILNENKLIKLDNLDENSKIYQVKNEIKKQEYIPIEEQILYYNNLILDNYKSLSDYTKDFSRTWNLLILEKPYDIIIKSMFNKEIVIKNITSQLYVEEIFLILFYYYYIHPDDISLICQGKILEKNKKVSYYNIVDNSTINIIIKTKTGLY